MILRFFFGFLIVIFCALVFFYPNFIKPKNSVKGAAFFSSEPELLPRRVDNFQTLPPISAKSAIVVDRESGIALFEKDATMRLLPASTTKLLTALVALENCYPTQLITVNNEDREPATMGLVRGDMLTVESLLYGLLVASGNDAAFTLAEACSKSQDQFVVDMNLKAKKLGMSNSHFTNPAGFDDITQYTTARDLAKLARAAVADPLLAKIVATKSVVVNDVTGNRTYYLSNVNKLIGEVAGTDGIKTGQTNGAQENLVTKTTRGENSIIAVVLGSKDRFSDSKILIEWAFSNYQWIKND